MGRKINELLGKYWATTLLVIALILFCINTILFYPGYMSPDSIDSLNQAVNLSLLHDWHPPFFALTWHALIALTGTPASMLVFQLGIEWLMLALLSLYVYRKTGLKKLSVAVLGAGLLPITLGVSGVIWKDVHMANLLGLAVVLILYFKHIERKLWRVSLLVIIILLIGSAFLLRYNIAFATIPLVYLALRQYGGVFMRKKIMVISIIVIFAMMIVAIFVVNAVFNARQTNAVSAVMLDDIVHTQSRESISNAGLPPTLADALIRADDTCSKGKIIVNSYIACTDDRAKESISSVYYGQLKGYWLHSIASRPTQYLSFRIHAFAFMLFAPQSNAYVWQEGIAQNSLNQEVSNKELGGALRIYVVDFGYKHFSFLYEAWFWLAVSIFFVGYSRRLKNISVYVSMISLSAMIYIISYIPVVVAADYRYIYWPVIALLIVGIVTRSARIKKKDSKS